MLRAAFGLLTLLALVAGGCATTQIHVVDAAAAHALLPFIADGTTMRAEVRAHLGLPGHSFEDGRIVAYRLTRQGNALVVVPPEEEDRAEYELILSYDTRHVLARHSLLRLW